MDAVYANRLAALQLEHTRLMKRLYEAVGLKLWARSWAALTEDQRAQATAGATRMCENWRRDAALRDSYAGGVAEIVDLVAQQHHIAEQIVAAGRPAVSLL